MNRNPAIARVSSTLVVAAMLLGSTAVATAQDATGFLGIAGVVSDSVGTAKDGITIKVRNSSTNRSEQSTTPSVQGSTAGFYFVAQTDFSGNRAARVGDTLTIEAFNGTSAVAVTPNTTTVTSADVSSSLLRLNLTLGTGQAVDKTPPELTLTYDQSASAVSPGGTLNITAAANETIAAGPVSISIQGPTTAPPSTGTMDRANDQQFTFAFPVPPDTGTYTVSISGAADAAGNAAPAPKNNAFRVGSSIAAPNVAIGNVTASAGGTATVGISLTNVTGTDVGGVQLSIAYETNQVSFQSATNGSALDSSYSAAVSDSTPNGTLSVVVFGLAADAIPNGEVVSLSFSVASTAAQGVTALAGTNLLLGDPSGTEIPGGTLTSGGITVGEATADACTKFDLTGDGRVNIFDILAEVNAVLSDTDKSNPKFDLNSSGGNANIFDILAVVNKVLELAPGGGTCP